MKGTNYAEKVWQESYSTRNTTHDSLDTMEGDKRYTGLKTEYGTTILGTELLKIWYTVLLSRLT